MLNWEIVDSKSGMMRAKIFGGWIVKTFQVFEIIQQQDLRKINMPVNGMFGLAYVPDPEYKWTIEVVAVPVDNPSDN